MITRIVKLTLQPDKVTDFIALFNSSKSSIRNTKGCNHVELLCDIKLPHLFFTYSSWDSEEDLNRYRDSELFKNIWSKTKPMFSEKAEAWSLKPGV